MIHRLTAAWHYLSRCARAGRQLLLRACNWQSFRVAAMVLGFSSCMFGQSPGSIDRISKVGATRTEPASSIRVLDAEGMRTLLGRRGRRRRPLVLYLFYTACRPCTDRLAEIAGLFTEYGARGLDVALVSIAPMDDQPKMLELLGRIDSNIPAFLLNSLDDDFAEEFFLRAWEPVVPAVFFYNAHGDLEYSEVEADAITFPRLRRLAEKLLRQPDKN